METIEVGLGGTLTIEASMGPRFCKRGNDVSMMRETLGMIASMGPRFCKRGNLRLARKVGMNGRVLQWGHAFVSVETQQYERNKQHNIQASMGPRFCKRGNLAEGLA